MEEFVDINQNHDEGKHQKPKKKNHERKVIVGRKWTLGCDKFGQKNTRLWLETAEDPNMVYLYRLHNPGEKIQRFVCSKCQSKGKYTVVELRSGKKNLYEKGEHTEDCKRPLQTVLKDQEKYAKLRSSSGKENFSPKKSLSSVTTEDEENAVVQENAGVDAQEAPVDASNPNVNLNELFTLLAAAFLPAAAPPAPEETVAEPNLSNTPGAEALFELIRSCQNVNASSDTTLETEPATTSPVEPGQDSKEPLKMESSCEEESDDEEWKPPENDPTFSDDEQIDEKPRKKTSKKSDDDEEWKPTENDLTFSDDEQIDKKPRKKTLKKRSRTVSDSDDIEILKVIPGQKLPNANKRIHLIIPKLNFSSSSPTITVANPLSNVFRPQVTYSPSPMTIVVPTLEGYKAVINRPFGTFDMCNELFIQVEDEPTRFYIYQKSMPNYFSCLHCDHRSKAWFFTLPNGSKLLHEMDKHFEGCKKILEREKIEYRGDWPFEVDKMIPEKIIYDIHEMTSMVNASLTRGFKKLHPEKHWGMFGNKIWIEASRNPHRICIFSQFLDGKMFACTECLVSKIFLTREEGKVVIFHNNQHGPICAMSLGDIINQITTIKYHFNKELLTLVTKEFIILPVSNKVLKKTIYLISDDKCCEFILADDVVKTNEVLYICKNCKFQGIRTYCMIETNELDLIVVSAMSTHKDPKKCFNLDVEKMKTKQGEVYQPGETIRFPKLE
uniref:Uncharacterized protein n=1 Tax=Panagrolaimus sp. JU765 TaxID=591449 RepID=A0AC34QXK0_9BILA